LKEPYLFKRGVSVPFPDIVQHGQDIVAFNIIRNRIVHDEGHLPGKNSKDYRILEMFAKRWHDDISIENNEIELYETFLFRVIKTFYPFFDELLSALKVA